jgi:hypothetical protein
MVMWCAKFVNPCRRGICLPNQTRCTKWWKQSQKTCPCYIIALLSCRFIQCKKKTMPYPASLNYLFQEFTGWPSLRLFRNQHIFLLQILCFWTLFTVLSLFKMSSCFSIKTQHFRNWILSPSSGKTYSVGAIDRASPYLWTEKKSNFQNIVFWWRNRTIF